MRRVCLCGMRSIRGTMLRIRRWRGRLSGFAWCVRDASGSVGVLVVSKLLLLGGIRALLDRRVVTEVIRRDRYRRCRRCPYLDSDALQCMRCRCYVPFKVTVNADCPAAEEGYGWGAVDK
jgi:hypothetical protein